MTLLSLQVLIEKLSVGFWWYATLDPHWYSVPRTEEVKRNFGAAVCQRAHEPWTIKVRSKCAKLSNRQVCLCAWESQAQLAFWSRAHLLYFSLTPSGRLYLSICPCSSQVAEEWRGAWMEGGGAERGKVPVSEPGSCSSAVECQVTAPSFVLGGSLS